MGLGPLDAAALLLAYLLGSIPFSYLVARRRGVDVRAVGSGNVGATNVLRNVGRAAGLAAFALDFLKGTAATAIASRAGGPVVGAVAAAVAVLGHMYPVWLSFRGGKGVATGAGAFLPLMPVPTAIGLVLFAAVAALTRYVSLGSVVGASALPVSAFLLSGPSPAAWSSSVVAALIVWKHRSNLGRILARTEGRLGSGPAARP
ncbi:MAG TPA: glycerol-3-phosphate 1-O-acyltransferase PlsY [Vicinamibacteria bacterium]|nr:glycerol-3-phosphate 1-O-acyltransferase PlsY [Vicinamibacteria bacterium]